MNSRKEIDEIFEKPDNKQNDDDDDSYQFCVILFSNMLSG